MYCMWQHIHNSRETKSNKCLRYSRFTHFTIKKYKEVLSIAKEAHILLGCKGITRSDFRYNNKKFFLLEVNTQPGMTNLSLVPEIAAYRGIKFEDLVEWMVKDAGYDR